MFQRSDINMSVRQANSLSLDDDLSPPQVTQMIKDREVGPNFNHGQQCKINNVFLPNNMRRIAKYHNKPFCGTFSRDGKFLLTTTHGIYTYLVL